MRAMVLLNKVVSIDGNKKHNFIKNPIFLMSNVGSQVIRTGLARN